MIDLGRNVLRQVSAIQIISLTCGIEKKTQTHKITFGYIGLFL